jgi:hypothetical protein
MATFRSAVDAVRCAVDIQADASESPLQVRAGVHAGEPIAEEGDVFGTAVNTASRLCSAAAPGEVLVSDVVRSLVGRRGALGFEDRGNLTLKGLGEPVPAYRVVAAGAPAPIATPSAPSPTGHLDQPERSLLCPVVVSRERELDVLTAALDGVPGRGGVVVLAGEAGVGKTRG